MTITASRRSAVEPFHAMDVLAEANRLKAAGLPIISMAVGQPSSPAPRPVREAAAVALQDGRIGWMAPSVITASGNLGLLPFVTPPPLPPTPTPLPTATPSPTPFSQANLVAGIVVFDPPTPTCAQTFIVAVDVANLGSEQTFAPGVVTVSDARASDSTVQQTAIGGFPPLLPGQTTRVNIPLTITTYYNEVHRLTITVDSSNVIPESNEQDNVRVIDYVLQKGACP